MLIGLPAFLKTVLDFLFFYLLALLVENSTPVRVIAVAITVRVIDSDFVRFDGHRLCSVRDTLVNQTLKLANPTAEFV